MPRRPRGEGSITLRRDGRYQARAWLTAPDGSRHRWSACAKTKTAARELLRDQLEKDRHGIPSPIKTWTVERYLHHWFDDVVRFRNRPATAKSYECAIRLYLVPNLGKRTLKALTVADVQQLVNQLGAAGHGARTIRNVRTVLSAALSRAEKEELVFRNVARLVDPPHYERKAIRPWTVDEARRFLDHVRGHRWESGFQMLVLYGMRRGEVLGLRWGDIDFENDTFAIEQQIQRLNGQLLVGPVKTSAGRRTLPLLPSVREVLLRSAVTQGIQPPLSGNPRLSPIADRLVLQTSTGNAVDPKNFVRTFHALREQAGLPRITVHHTRHTTATMLKNLGIPARDAQTILGHSDVTTTQQLYQHTNLEDARNAMTAIEGELFGPAIYGDLRAATGSHLDRLGDFGRQPRARCPSDNTFPDIRQTIKTNENRRSTGVRSAAFVGTPGRIRTCDLLVRRPLLDSLALLPTTVIQALHRRSQCMILGRLGVSLGTAAPCLIDDLRAERDLYAAALAAKLRRLSFPQSLLPSTPLTDLKEDTR